MMDKIGRSTWANLVKEAKKQNVALPERHTSKLQIEEEEGEDEYRDPKSPQMKRVDGDENSPN